MSQFKKAGDAGAREAGIEALKAMDAAAKAQRQPKGDEPTYDDLGAELDEFLEGDGEGANDPVAALAASLDESGYKDPDAWRGSAKAALVALGLPEMAAHQTAYHGGDQKKVEAIVQRMGGTVGSEPSQPAQRPAEAGSGAGNRLSELLDELEDGEAKEKLASELETVNEDRALLRQLRAEVDSLKGQQRESATSSLTEQIRASQQELAGEYPELQDPAEWQQLQPLVLGFAAQGLGIAPALRAAALSRYGARVAPEGSPRQSATPPAPGIRVNSGQARAMTPAHLKARVAAMVFEGRALDEIERFKANVKARTGIEL